MKSYSGQRDVLWFWIVSFFFFFLLWESIIFFLSLSPDSCFFFVAQSLAGGQTKLNQHSCAVVTVIWLAVYTELTQIQLRVCIQ